MIDANTTDPTVLATALFLVASATVLSGPVGAQTAPPWDGNPISPGLGPTYGETWCAPPSGATAEQQGPPLALIPYEAIGCTLQRFEDEAADAGVSDRMDYEVIGRSVLGRDILGVVVNALETPQQQQAYARWQQLRSLMFHDPAQAQALLQSWGENVKLPIFIEANIHGNEEEGTDAIMQVIRDMVTLPYETNEAVDDLLDHAILVVIPTANPDGRVAGVRRNANAFDMNRDLLVQSQPEVRANTAFQQEWLAPVGLFMHGYFSPTLVDGLTKPHNPGLEYDKFLYWNQRRLDANEVAYTNAGMEIIRPVNDWNSSGWFGRPPVGPAYAEGWDDWGPFYTQTYGAFFGVDGSTLEMCEDGAGCDGRFGSKRAQYIGFYSSADFWIQNRGAILTDQLEIFRRGVEDADRVNCCDDPLIASYDFTEDQHDWMVEYPKAYVIPFVGDSGSNAQRSDAEANRMAQWLMDNGVEVHRASGDFSWGGQTFPQNSYVVWMDQALRGIALTALSAGQDVSDRITQLYAPPGAWSHGLLWGADVAEIPRADASFSPATVLIAEVNPLDGGVRDGDPADWFAVTLQGTSAVRAVLDLLRDGIDGEVAEEPFASTTAGQMPAGSLIFDASTEAALEAAGGAAGVFFERGVGATPATTQLDEAPTIAILVDSKSPAENDTSWSLRQIFGDDVGFVSMVLGKDSLERAPTDPLQSYDVIYNLGQGYPAARHGTARARLQDFFERGGGYIGTSVASANFSFLTGAVPALIQGALTQGSDSADGGIARWSNAGAAGPLTGGFSSTDNLYLPANVTWFSSIPSGATVDGRYLGSVNTMFIAGLWRDRSASAANAPVIVHGTTTVGSRYLGFATNPFSRGDAEREWPLIGQAALWSNLTDE
ncbi:MAG: M14 family zinc carboxypeptidase [Actinomycetota bacterium]